MLMAALNCVEHGFRHEFCTVVRESAERSEPAAVYTPGPRSDSRADDRWEVRHQSQLDSWRPATYKQGSSCKQLQVPGAHLPSSPVCASLSSAGREGACARKVARSRKCAHGEAADADIQLAAPVVAAPPATGCRTSSELVMTNYKDILKSPNDPKLYRWVTLDNGLTALLIQDLDIKLDDRHDAQGRAQKSPSKAADVSHEQADGSLRLSGHTICLPAPGRTPSPACPPSVEAAAHSVHIRT
jgi:hypothetical protein